MKYKLTDYIFIGHLQIIQIYFGSLTLTPGSPLTPKPVTLKRAPAGCGCFCP